MKDEEIEKLILAGEAIPAEAWIAEDPRRRLGEAVFSEGHAKRNIETSKNQGMELWIHNIKFDKNGLEYASSIIYRLPKLKSHKKNIIRGFNLSRVIAGLTPIEFIDQKYVYVISLSAEQVEAGINTMKSTWGGISKSNPRANQ